MLKERISGLILAAGAGSRFEASGGGVKQLADVGGRPLLQWAVDAHCAVPELERVVVVLGAHAEAIAEVVMFGRAEPVVCVDWKLGRSASLQIGMKALAESDRVIVTLGDQPLVTADLIRHFLEAPPGTRALHMGVPGHPVVLGPEHVRSIGELVGDRGAGELLNGGHTVECGKIAPLAGIDVDTVAGLRAAAALVDRLV